jgi:hypothetical protein
MKNEHGPVINALPRLVWSALPDGHIDFLNQGREYTVLLLPKPLAAGAAERIYDNNTFTCVSGR